MCIRDSGNTPLREAQQRIGEYYKAGTKPGGGAVADPIQYLSLIHISEPTRPY